jgi:tetraacyldisaccharide 4'-kinase
LGRVLKYLRYLLLPISFLYFIGLQVWCLLYKLGIKKKRQLSVPVVSVGNITWGGTGKTSLVIYIAKCLASKGIRVGIVSRGYKGKARKPLVVSDGYHILCSWKDSGDEPWMIADTLLQYNVAVAIGRNRFDAGNLLLKLLPLDIILLDDGFQHLPLRRDVNIVCLHAKKPFGHGLLLPAGNLRETKSALNRSHFTVVVGESKTTDFLQAKRQICGFRNLAGGSLSIDEKVFITCAIGNPHDFLDNLKELNIDIAGYKFYSDHHQFSEGDIENIASQAQSRGADTVILTRKDAVKIEMLSLPDSVQWLIADYTLVETNDWSELWGEIFSAVSVY